MKKYDLVVVGGGISGVAAAVSGAREGLSVLLIEKEGVLGGAMSNNLVYPFMRCTTKGENSRLINAGIFKEMLTRYGNHKISYEIFKFIFDDMVISAGVDVLFHATVFDVKTEGRNIKSVSVNASASVFDISADFFIDATGDGELIALSGCEFQLGREQDGLCQPMTTCFRLGGIDVKKFCDEQWNYIDEWYNIQRKYKEWKKEGKIKNPRENILVFFGLGDGVGHFNTTRVIKHDPTNPFELSEAEIISRQQILEMIDFLKENSEACKNAFLISVANGIGIRESRKLKGVYILTQEDIVSCREFEDTIALGSYDIDIHNPEGTGTHIHEFGDGEYYKIPYRSLLPKEYDNMLVAGRCLSADHYAHSAVRIMPICACLGEAAGTALAIAKKSGKNAHSVDIGAVRQRLEENGAAVR